VNLRLFFARFSYFEKIFRGAKSLIVIFFYKIVYLIGSKIAHFASRVISTFNLLRKLKQNRTQIAKNQGVFKQKCNKRPFRVNFCEFLGRNED